MRNREFACADVWRPLGGGVACAAAGQRKNILTPLDKITAGLLSLSPDRIKQEDEKEENQSSALFHHCNILCPVRIPYSRNQLVLFSAPWGDGLRLSVTGQQLAIRALRLVKLAKKAHHPGRREGDFNYYFSLPRDIYIHVLIGDAEVV